MVLTVRRKGFLGIRKCIPGFINLFDKGGFIIEYGGREVLRKMKDYDVYLKPRDKWMDLTYAYEEGFLDPMELGKW